MLETGDGCERVWSEDTRILEENHVDKPGIRMMESSKSSVKQEIQVYRGTEGPDFRMERFADSPG